jgi:predicted Ser/Thr protein kinase
MWKIFFKDAKNDTELYVEGIPIPSSKSSTLMAKSLPELNVTEVTKVRLLNSGSFGKVYEGKYRNTIVAIKEMDKDSPDIHSLKKEIELIS